MKLKDLERLYDSPLINRIDKSKILGYSEDELEKIEKLYDIEIRGDFRDFMLKMGRCSGGLIGDDPIILYRRLWGVRTQILKQSGFLDEWRAMRQYEYTKKPFIFSIESETQYYFLVTESNDDTVYHYDENEETFNSTGLSFIEYMCDAIKRYDGYGDINVICQGELLLI